MRLTVAYTHSARKYALKRYMETLWGAMKPGGLFLSLIGNAEDGAHWGPARVTAFEVLAEHHPISNSSNLSNSVLNPPSGVVDRLAGRPLCAEEVRS